MQLSDFHFDLPSELIAQFPLRERSSSRLLCLNKKTGAVDHHRFTDILNWVNEGDLLIFNNTKVLPARLFATKATGGKVEILLERIVSDKVISAQLKASKALKPGSELFLTPSTSFVVQGRHDNLFMLELVSEKSLFDVLHECGEMPLPPYIGRQAEESDSTRYQTVFAEKPGAVAAPTAGLHFDEPLMQALLDKKVGQAFVTLHVGAGTFSPVRVDNITEHTMHAEHIEISQAVVDRILATKAAGKRVIAVGTTSVRVLESAVQEGVLKPYTGDTQIFIYPGYQFQVVEGLITNFHLPESTLMMLVSALASRDFIMNAYQQAIEERYRFFSYGDAMLIY